MKLPFRKFFSPTSLVWWSGKAALAAGIVFFRFGVDELSEYQEISIPTLDLNSLTEQETKREKVPFDKFEGIVKRNIFGEVAKKAGPKQEAKAPSSAAVELRLVGTHFRSKNEDRIALIENSKKSEQDIFSVGEKVFDDGITLLGIEADHIEVEINGELKTLALDDGAKGGSGSSAAGDGDKFSVPEDELNTALSNLPELLSQARAVPYFRNGQSIGMRLFAIRKSSLYEKLGLKNGDIVKTVNDNNIGDPTQALKLFEQLKSERKINVVVERGGEDKTLGYSID